MTRERRARSRLSGETAKALASPFFAWTNAVLKGGEMMLYSMQSAARTARPGRAKARRRR